MPAKKRQSESSPAATERAKIARTASVPALGSPLRASAQQGSGGSLAGPPDGGASLRDIAGRNVVSVTLKNVCADYVREMLFEIIRDGEISDSEQKMMLWAIIISAQIWVKDGDRIPIPSGPDAMRAYMRTQGPTIQQFMEVVHPRIGGVRQNAFVQRKRRQRSWIGSSAAGGGFLGVAISRLAQFVADAIVPQDLLEAVTPEELLSACEMPEELEFSRAVGLCLHFLAPLAPTGYLFKTRMSDFLIAYRAKGYLDVDIVTKGARFFCACLLYTYSKKAFDFLIALLYLRVVLCFGTSIPFFGRSVCMLSAVVELWTEWDQNHYLLGCPDEGQPTSMIQVVPDQVADILAHLISKPSVLVPGIFVAINFSVLHKRLQLSATPAAGLSLLILIFLAAGVTWLDLAAPESLFLVADALSGHILFRDAVRVVRAVIRGIINFLFTVLLVDLLRRIVEIADEFVQPKLLLMSLKLGTHVRFTRGRAASESRGG